MKREEINKIAHQCQLPYYFHNNEIVGIESLEIFVREVIARVRESDAQVCDGVAKSYQDNDMPTAALIAGECAELIRRQKND